jgi:DNA polymerase
VLVGEQPGDEEDLLGRPFVGPAGRVLDQALEAAGVSRDKVYLTNAVKHFKFEPRGKRRLHSKPNAAEIHACHAWLDAELATLNPTVVVCLGATAVGALLGRAVSVTRDRGQPVEAHGRVFMATWHPSAILRAPDPKSRATMRADLVRDLASAWVRADSGRTSSRGD